MKKFSEAVLAPHKHMSKKASPYHAHSKALVYTPSGKEEIRPIDTADAGYGGEAVADAQGGEADAGRASKKAVSPMKMQTLVKKTTNEETERERLKRLRSFAYQQRLKGLGDDIHEPVYEEQIDELKKSTLASYAKKATDDVSYNSFMAGALSKKDPNRLVHDKRAFKRQVGIERAVNKMVKEDEQLDELSPEARKNKMRTMGVNAAIQHPKKVDFAGGAIQMYRQAVKKLSSKEMSDVAKKLPKVNEEGYKLVAKTKAGETFTSKTHDTKAAAQQAHYKMAKGGGYKKITLTKVHEQDSWNGPEEENDMAMTQLHFIKYAAEKIMAAIEVGTDMEEWYQNKLSKLHSDMESLYSYMQGTTRYHGTLGNPVAEGKMKDIATNKAEDERLAARAASVLGGPVKKMLVGPKGKHPLGYRLARSAAKKAMKAGHSVSEERKSKVPRIGPMEKALEEQEVWDKPMPDSKKQGSLSPEQKAKAKARAERAGRSYPNMIDNMWASKQ